MTGQWKRSIQFGAAISSADEFWRCISFHRSSMGWWSLYKSRREKNQQSLERISNQDQAGMSPVFLAMSIVRNSSVLTKHTDIPDQTRELASGRQSLLVRHNLTSSINLEYCPLTKDEIATNPSEKCSQFSCEYFPWDTCPDAWPKFIRQDFGVWLADATPR